MALSGGGELGSYAATSKEVCCAMCRETHSCAGAAFHPGGGDGGCVLRSGPLKTKANPAGFVCVVNPKVRDIGGGHRQKNANWVMDGTDI